MTMWMEDQNLNEKLINELSDTNYPDRAELN